MRRSHLATLLVITALVAASGAARAPTPSSSTGGNVEPALDTVAPDTVAVVASGAPVDGAVPVIVRNGTTRAVTVVRIRAVAVDGSGRSVARAATPTVVPRLLEPDGLGLARVQFEDATVPVSATYEFDVTSTRARNTKDVALEPTAIAHSPPSTGSVAQTFDITLRNPEQDPVRGPVRLAVMCFGEARRPSVVGITMVGMARIAPGADRRVTVGSSELCPTYLVAANAIRAT
jgi:hypothetical protein